MDAHDDFEAAFAGFAKDVDTGKPVENAEAPAEGGDNGQGDNNAAATDSSGGAAAVDAPAVAGSDGVDPAAAPEAVGEGGDAPAADPAVTEAEPAADASDAEAEDILKRLADLVKDKPAEGEPVAEAAPAADETPLFSADEQAVLEAYEKDWSDVSRAEALKRRAFAKDVIEYVFSQIAPEIKSVKELTEALANRAHYADLTAKIGEVDDTLRTQMDGWVAKQPAYLQSAYKQVLTTGTVDEVADLVERFKKDTGVAAPAAKPKTSKGGPELSSEAKQAAEAMAPVSSKRSVIEQQDDPNDFGAAFAKFSEMFKE